MKIAVDARELAGKPTGVGTYLGNLLAEWSRMPEACAHEWVLYRAGQRPSASAWDVGAPPSPAPDALPPRTEWRTVPGTGGTWWEQRSLPAAIRRDRPNVLFAPAYTAPLALRIPIVLTVHDVSFMAHPEWFAPREGLRRRVLTRLSARKARKVITVSRFSQREIATRAGVPENRIRVVYSGVRRSPGQGTQSDSRTVLYVGSIFNRRRVPDLVSAFARVAARVPGARLEIVGDNRTHPHEDLAALSRSLGVESVVNLRSYVDGEELERLYREATVFAFLSEYEGFGLTPLEALAHGVPAVLLDTPVAREICEDAAVYVPRNDLPGTADALCRLLVDAEARTAQVSRAQRVLDRYCWEKSARETLGVLEEAVRG